MSSKNIGIIVAVVVVLAIIAYSLGWFGGDAVEEPAPAATGTTTTN